MKDSLITYLVLAIVLLLLLPDSFCFAEQWRTFYWDAAHCREVMAHDGLWQLVQDFFIQFMASPVCMALILAIPCALVSMLLTSLIRPLCYRFIPLVSRLASALLPLLLAIILTSVSAYFLLFGMHGDNARFKSMMCQVEDEDWGEIIASCEGRKVSNLLELNMLNLALAETGQLQQRLTRQSNSDVNSLFVLNIESPYVAALLGDIYWSMGEISMSQMYAFEANEKMNNLSPRLLKRLVLTNIAFGHYEVAAKYLNWLDKTLFYREWSEHYRSLLSDEAVLADETMRLKRACIPAENGFPSAQSVAYDLEQIISTNPAHRPSAEYLGALKKLYGIQ